MAEVMSKEKAFDYMQVPLAIVATDLTGVSVEVEGAYFRLARLLGVNGPMKLADIRRKIGEVPDVEHLLDHSSADVEPLFSFGWLEEWRCRAKASRERMSEKGRASAAKRAEKKSKKNKRSTHVEQQHNNGSTAVEHTTILSSTLLSGVNSGEKERAESKPTEPLPFASPAFAEAVARWERHRAEIKHKLTPEARKAWLKKCEAMGEAAAIAAIDHSIANGWTGMFPPKTDDHRPPAPHQSAERKDLVTDWDYKSKRA